MPRNPLVTAFVYIIALLSPLPSSFHSSVAVASTVNSHTPSTNQPLRNISCGNGVEGQTIRLQQGSSEPFQPDIYITDCSGLKSLPPSHNSLGPIEDDKGAGWSQASRFGKRQINKCGDSCGTFCGFGDGPSDNDCAALSNWLEQRGSQFTVGGFQKVSVTRGTCIYTFTNTNILSVQWCDATWAAQGRAVANGCSAGGSCLGLLYAIGVERNPNPPPAPAPTLTPTPTPRPITTPAPAPQPTSTPNQPTVSGEAETPSGGGNNPPSTSRSPSSSNSNGITSISGVAISEYSSVLSPSNLAALSSSLAMLSSLTVTTSRMQVTTLSNGVVFTLPTDDDISPIPSEGPSEQISRKKRNLAAIIAGVLIGCFVLLGMIIAFFRWKRKQQAKNEPIGIYIDPTMAREFGGPGSGKGGGLGSPIARTIYSASDDHDQGFGRAARGTSMMSGDTDLTIWTPRARARHENGVGSTMMPLSPLVLDMRRLSVSNPPYEMTSAATAVATSDAASNEKSRDSPVDQGTQSADTSLVLHHQTEKAATTTPMESTYPYRYINSTIFDNSEQVAHLERKPSKNSTEESCYSRDDGDFDVRYQSAPPVVIPELMSPANSTKRITDVSVGAVGGAMNGNGFGLGRGRESSTKSRVTSVGTNYQREETHLPGLDAEIEELRRQQQQQNQQLPHLMQPLGQPGGRHQRENSEDAYAGFASLTRAFESASSVQQDTIESSGVSRESLVVRRL